MTDALGELVRRVLKEAPFAMRQLAADSGLSYDVLRSWRSGRRRPSRASAARLAAGLQRRAEQLQALSQELREAAEGRGPEADGRESAPADNRARAAQGSRDQPQVRQPAAQDDRDEPQVRQQAAQDGRDEQKVRQQAAQGR